MATATPTKPALALCEEDSALFDQFEEDSSIFLKLSKIPEKDPYTLRIVEAKPAFQCYCEEEGEDGPKGYTVYSRSVSAPVPATAKVDDKGKVRGWVKVVLMVVYDANCKMYPLRFLPLTQTTIMRELIRYARSPEWGDWASYNIKFFRKGEKIKAEYSVQPVPHTPMPKEAVKALSETTIDFNQMLDEGAPTPFVTASEDDDLLS